MPNGAFIFRGNPYFSCKIRVTRSLDSLKGIQVHFTEHNSNEMFLFYAHVTDENTACQNRYVVINGLQHGPCEITFTMFTYISISCR